MKILHYTLLISLLVFKESFAATQVGTANAKVVIPIVVTATSPLQFGSFAAGGTAGTINQAGVVTGGVTAITSVRSAGGFTVTGETTNTSYTFTLPSSVTLTKSGGGSMTASLSYGIGNGSRILVGGSDNIIVNGVLAVGANQAPGAYAGTYNVTAVY